MHRPRRQPRAESVPGIDSPRSEPAEPTRSSSAFRPEVRRALPTLIILRLVINTGGRMAFTFLPEFSRGTGLTIDELGRLLSLRDATGLAAPLIGRYTDRTGTRRIMLAGAVVTVTGLLLFSLGSIGVLIGLALWGLGRVGYQVGMAAWVGNEVAYERRGRATGQVEMTWAGAALIGIPAMGLLIDRWGWRAAPLTLAALSVPLTVLLAARMSATTPIPDGVAPRSPARIDRTVIGSLTAFSLLSGSIQFLVLSHGIWLEETYRFDAARLGFAVTAIGTAELVASYASSRITDRLGKKRSFLAGAVVMTIGLFALAAAPTPPLWLGLALLVVTFLGFEFGIVSAIPLVSELDPGARARTIGLALGLSIVARSVTTPVASWLIGAQGFRAVMMVAGAVAVITVVSSTMVVEPNPGDDHLPG